jgi:hypothetical protein
MRDQYAGDLSDLLKFALLRALALDDKTIGVGWYYNPTHDKLQDGRHREHCDEPKWKSLDRAVWSALKELPERSVNALEKLPIWPTNTRFHRIPVPRAGDRASWASNMTTALQDASIVFLDPDNGVGNASEQHATVAEVAAISQSGRAVVLIKFPEWGMKHDQQIEKYHRSLLTQTGALTAVTVRTCVSVWVLNKKGVLPSIPRVRWFTLVDADDALIDRAEQFARRLSEIEKCKADVVHGVESIATSPEKPHAAAAKAPVSMQSRITQPPPTTGQSGRVANVCPECGHQFKGHGFDGIDAHWRARHEAVLPYREAWPLIKFGNYRRSR